MPARPPKADDSSAWRPEEGRKLKLDIVASDPGWRRRVRAIARFARQAAIAAHAAALEDDAPPLTGPVALALANDEAIERLNRQFRGKPKPTNVLSFPSAHGGGGDIMLALETVAGEAEAQGKSFEAHAAHLIAHGILHLMGYDHIAEDEAERMERLERRILGRLGHPDPYQELKG